LFSYCVSKFGARNFVGQRETLPNGKRGKFVFYTYAEVDGMARAFAAGLKVALGLKTLHRIAFYSRNRYAFWFCFLLFVLRKKKIEKTELNSKLVRLDVIWLLSSRFLYLIPFQHKTSNSF